MLLLPVSINKNIDEHKRDNRHKDDNYDGFQIFFGV